MGGLLSWSGGDVAAGPPAQAEPMNEIEDAVDTVQDELLRIIRLVNAIEDDAREGRVSSISHLADRMEVVADSLCRLHDDIDYWHSNRPMQ